VKSHFINKINSSDIISREVLFEGDKVQLTTVQKINTENRTERDQSKSANSLNTPEITLCISKEENVLPMSYLVMLLRQMETIRPMSDDDSPQLTA
jgi:ATP-dependent DNA helicase RecQ